LAAIFRRKAGGRPLSLIVIFHRYLIAAFIVNFHAHLLAFIVGSSRKPILVAGIEIDRDQRRLVRLERAGPVSVANLEAVIREGPCQIERRLPRVDFAVRLCKSNSKGERKEGNIEAGAFHDVLL